jgi:hypothetical protein
MLRNLIATGTFVLMSAFAMMPLDASACGGGEGHACACNHGNKEKAATKVDPGSSAGAKVGRAAVINKDTAVKKAEQVPAAISDQAIAAKCSCESQADCTCKKGQCECKKCGSKHHGEETASAH